LSLTDQSNLSEEQVAANFADIKPALTGEHAITEANRCLYCYDAPCAIACPTHIDIPEFIRRIGSGNLKGAAETILESNILGASCARVCPTQELCEGSCVMHHLKMPAIDIGRLQRHAVDHVMEHNVHVLKPYGNPEGKPVAVVGGGPAGLSAAAELSRLGHKAVVFEANAEAGGLNRYGIAPYKLTNEESNAEVKYVQDMCKFEIKTGVRVGQDLSLEQLDKDYAAVYLGVGMSTTRKMGIPGENLAGFIGATEWIEALRSKPLHETSVGKKVIVVGAGNTAIDAATESARLGAEVVIVYRRGIEDMPAYEFEYHLALQDKVRFFWYTNPVAVLGTDKVTGLRCQKMAPGEADASGRPRPVPVAGSEFEIEADWVILATGQENHKSLYEQLKLEMSGSKVKVNADFQTSNPKYFAGGDCINGGKEVVNAVADGKKAAHAIHQFLGKKG
jgi:dihydropyrimidine dehydrogenase (NAD+) subunit PreT